MIFPGSLKMGHDIVSCPAHRPIYERGNKSEQKARGSVHIIRRILSLSKGVEGTNDLCALHAEQ